MKQILQTLKEISQNPLRVYIGDGIIENMEISLNEGVSEQILSKYTDYLPDHYLQMVRFSNGIQFFNSGDHILQTLNETLEMQDAYGLKSNFYPIGYILGDLIILVVAKDKQAYTLFAGDSTGLDEFIDLEQTLDKFIENLLISNCSKFWNEYYKYKDLHNFSK